MTWDYASKNLTSGDDGNLGAAVRQIERDVIPRLLSSSTRYADEATWRLRWLCALFHWCVDELREMSEIVEACDELRVGRGVYADPAPDDDPAEIEDWGEPSASSIGGKRVTHLYRALRDWQAGASPEMGPAQRPDSELFERIVQRSDEERAQLLATARKVEHLHGVAWRLSVSEADSDENDKTINDIVVDLAFVAPVLARAVRQLLADVDVTPVK